MSTSALSNIALSQPLHSYFRTRNSDVQQLGQAIQSGNLGAAQIAYNNITAVGEGGPFASGPLHPPATESPLPPRSRADAPAERFPVGPARRSVK